MRRVLIAKGTFKSFGLYRIVMLLAACYLIYFTVGYFNHLKTLLSLHKSGPDNFVLPFVLLIIFNHRICHSSCTLIL